MIGSVVTRGGRSLPPEGRTEGAEESLQPRRSLQPSSFQQDTGVFSAAGAGDGANGELAGHLPAGLSLKLYAGKVVSHPWVSMEDGVQEDPGDGQLSLESVEDGVHVDPGDGQPPWVSGGQGPGRPWAW